MQNFTLSPFMFTKRLQILFTCRLSVNTGLMKKIPTVDDLQFNGMKLGQIKQYVKSYYNSNYKGRTVVNEHKQITVHLGREGLHHVLYARKLGYTKLKALVVIADMIKEAIYCNFKNADENDSNDILGYLNFKSEVIIEGSVYWFRIAVRLTNAGKFYYDHSVWVKK